MFGLDQLNQSRDPQNSQSSRQLWINFKALIVKIIDKDIIQNAKDDYGKVKFIPIFIKISFEPQST